MLGRITSGVAAVAGALIACVVLAPAAGALPTASGAPGEPHTWAPADKHGFGTATSLDSHVWFTLREAELSEIYYPDLSTPSFRDLEFAVVGRKFVDFETDARVSSRVQPRDGSLAFRQVTRTRQWRLTKTWITDAEASTVLADVRFQALTRQPLKLYVVADPAPGDDGNDDRGRSRGKGLLAFDDDTASLVAAQPALKQTTSGYAGTGSDPRRRLARKGRIGRRAHARKQGNVVQAARTRLTGRPGKHRMTLAIGFGEGAGAAQKAVRGSMQRGFAVAATAYRAGWSDYLASLDAPPASVAGDGYLRRLYEQSVMVLDASEDKRNRGASIASPTMPWVWGTLTLEGNETSGPYHLV
jgi:glucoamylase